MKQSRIFMISIVVIDLILMTFCIVAYGNGDRVKPEFFFQPDEYIYTYSDGEEAVLRSITARDDRDGDISERIVIEKVVENQSGSAVVVYYAVSDSAGNVAKTSRVFPADFKIREERGYMENETFGEGNDSVGEAVENVLSREDSKQDASNGEDVGEGQGIEGEQEIEEDEPEDVSEEENEDSTEQETAQAEPANEEPVSQEPPQEDRSGRPILTLRKQEVTIEAGTSPPWTEIIETLRDDKDDYAALYYNLVVSRFNKNQPGNYPVTLYTEDSDGNRSDTVSVTVHIR